MPCTLFENIFNPFVVDTWPIPLPESILKLFVTFVALYDLSSPVMTLYAGFANKVTDDQNVFPVPSLTRTLPAWGYVLLLEVMKIFFVSKLSVFILLEPISNIVFYKI
jgi:hypothetical protein